MFDDLQPKATESLAPSKASQGNNDELLIPISDDHNQQSFTNSQSVGGIVTHQPPAPFQSLDPTLDLTSISNGYCNNNDLLINNHLIINESETILPDVCTQPGNINLSVHSYGSNQDGENQPLLRRIDSESNQLIKNTFPDDAEFNGFIRDVEQAIENGFLPERIYQGSSGSYFVQNIEGNVRSGSSI